MMDKTKAGLAPSTAAGTSGTRIPPSWEEAYRLYRPLLFGALSKLATRGFATFPDDGLDLVHEFFLDSWQPIVKRYDARRAKFETYLYACFVHFARPRIIRLSRWRASLVSPDFLADTASHDPWLESQNEMSPDRSAIRDAISRLPYPESDILIAYASGTAGSERELAHRFSLTRYRLRLSLSDALGRLAVELNERGDFDEPEWILLQELWHHGRTIKEAAGALRLPLSDVQAMRTRMFERLTDAVRKRPRRLEMKTQHVNGEELLERALRQDAEKKDTLALRQNADLVLAFLEQPRAEVFFEKHVGQLTPERLAGIYGALGYDERVDSAEEEQLQAFLRASEEDEKGVGEAFAEALLPSLPVDMCRFSDSIFLGSAPINDDEYNALSREISVQSGGEHALELARFGITPVTILTASQGIANLALRFCDAKGIKRNGHMILGKVEGHRSTTAPVLRRSTSVDEVMLITELNEDLAGRLFDWIARSAGWIPNLFASFKVELWGDELRLTRTDIIEDDLFERWSPPPLLLATG